MSPSRTIHLGLSEDKFDMSRMIIENSPSFHSLVARFIKPYSSSVVTALGFISCQTGLSFML